MFFPTLPTILEENLDELEIEDIIIKLKSTQTQTSLTTIAPNVDDRKTSLEETGKEIENRFRTRIEKQMELRLSPWKYLLPMSEPPFATIGFNFPSEGIPEVCETKSLKLIAPSMKLPESVESVYQASFNLFTNETLKMASCRKGDSENTEVLLGLCSDPNFECLDEVNKI